MKKYLIIPLALVISLMFTNCEDYLDTNPDGEILTEDQVKDVIAKDASKLQAEINGLYSIMKAYGAGGGNQEDFGFPGIAVKLEHNGQDVVGDVTGYNWFSGEQDFTDRNYTYRAPRVIWNIFYKQIMMANSVINKVPAEPEDRIAKSYLGQALAVRAFDYFNLVQLYQFTYKGHEDAPAVPLVLDDTPLEQINNNPRASVQAIYDQILSDLDRAVELLDGSTRSDKSYIDQAVAYGLRARVNLVMQNWAAAASDAEMALQLSGEQPFSMERVSEPTFENVNVPGVLWGIPITPEDDAVQTGIANFTSMFTSFPFGYGGYTTIVGTWKKVSVLLYDQIPESDVRKGWWLDEDYTSPLLDIYEQNGTNDALFNEWYGEPYDAEEYGPFWAAMGMEPYTHVKFAPENKNPLDPNNSTDFPLMRAEEMYLIMAEAKAMAGQVAEGKAILENFVTTYRDPEFVSTASSAEELQNEVWLQRRIEFWGEGIAWFDIMRLKKPVIRKEDGVTSFGAQAIFNIPSETPYMLWPIPREEIQANEGISDAENNQMGTLPVSDPVKSALIKSANKTDSYKKINKSFTGFSKATY